MSSILVVEDNALTRQVVRLALERMGHAVLDAPTASVAISSMLNDKPDLVLQDLHLPDMDGIELVQKLRAIAGSRAVPIIAFSGLLSKIEEARALRAGFTDYLFKPVQPARLAEVVAGHLAPRRISLARPGESRRLLLVDDDPMQLELNQVQLEELGFLVDVARSGPDALVSARIRRPAVIVTDLLMPEMNGLELCLNVRRDVLLARTPVIVTTSTFAIIEDHDLRLAEQMGANALVVRSPGLSEVVDAVLDVLVHDEPKLPAAEADSLNSEYARRLMRQLEHQAGVNSVLARRGAMDAAMLSILTGSASILTREQSLPELMHEVLACALDAGGVSAGAIYLRENDATPALQSQIGFADAQAHGVSDFFGHADLLSRLQLEPYPTAIPSAAIVPEVSADVLIRAGAAAIVVAPLLAGGTSHGVLVMVSNTRDIDAGWLLSMAAVANQLGQAVALSGMMARLQQSETRYRSLFEGMPVGAWRSALDGRLLTVNPEFLKIYGAESVEQMLSKQPEQLYVDIEDRNRWRAELAETGDVRDFPLRVRRFDGSQAWVAMTARLGDDGHGDGAYYEGALIDITERKVLEERLVQSHKMEAIGKLAAGVAHDFNNILTAISGSAELLGMDLPGDDDSQRLVREIIEGARRAGTLTRQLLAFGRRQLLKPEVVDLNEVVAHTDAMLARLIGENIEVQALLDPDLPNVRLDPGQMEQVLLNLAVNARDAMASGGKLTIETHRVVFDEPHAEAHGLLQPGEYASLQVTDTGIGMDEETKQHIFEPFFTTKDQGKGTGLGLSTVYGIVKQSGGSILVYSEPGVGTTLKLYFPATAEQRVADVVPVPVHADGNDATILLVEDEGSVLRFAEAVLLRGGYRVLAAPSPADALRITSDLSVKIDAVLTDVVMPGMSGPDMVEQLRITRPGLPAVFMSGYAGGAVVRNGMIGNGAPFIDKPFSASALLTQLGNLLNR